MKAQTYMSEEDFVKDLRERLEGVPEAEWPEHLSEVELEILTRYNANQGR